MATRREFLQHSGTLGLGSMFLPFAAAVGNDAASKNESAATVPGLVLEKIEAGGISHYSYFIGDARAGVAAVIDPRRDVEVYVDLARKHRLTIISAIETHVHADFVSGSRELAHRTGAKIYASVEGGTEYGFSVVPLRDGAVLDVGDLSLKAIHTPGHTPEHMSFLGYSGGKPEKSWGLFTGDFLFAGSVGRPDLMGIENTGRLADRLYASLQTAFADLPDSLPIYPAHGPGSPCGAGIVEREGVPTLGIERSSNPALQFDEQQAFIDHLLFSQPPIPYYWPRVKRINARGPAVLGKLPTPKPLKPEELTSLVSDSGVQLLDTRHMLGFGGGHIRGALNIGYSPSLSMWGGWLLDPERPIAIVMPNEGSIDDIVAWLIRVGYSEFAGVLDNGMDAWVKAGQGFESVDQLSVHELREAMHAETVQVLDVRQPSEWDHGHLRDARYMFLPEIPKRMKELDASKPIAVYCGTGYRASIAASLLKRGGFKVYNVPGSFAAWLAAGYEVVVPDSPGKASSTHRV